ncbi:TRAP transporter large permease [Roseovarius sp. CAU 1744]|uniref:TRAP transporter large permease n=1 Tax=Roseovarius sp. CAU 1744 TaxID=3140368 RepID=UPI00325AC684
MIWYETLLLVVGALLFIMATGIPLFAAFLVVNVGFALILYGQKSLGLFANSIFSTTTSDSLIAIPLFILMGEILFRSGSIEILFRSVDLLIGRVRGRMYFVVTALSVVFGALSGSAVAVAAMLGRSVFPKLVEQGYSKSLSTSLILGGASLAPIIPPSVLVIVLGALVRDVSIAGLLVAGLLPGLLLSVMMLIYVFGSMYFRSEVVDAPSRDANEVKGLGDVAMSLVQLLPFSIVIFSVMGFILLGVATPSESAATGVVGAMLVAVIYRKFNLTMMRTAIVEAAKLATTILIIVACSKLFGQLLSASGATRGLIEYVVELDASYWTMFLILMLVPLILCMFLDQIAFMLLAVPLYEPIVQLFEYDPIWFWMLFLINLTVGSITPPFGYTLFSLKSATSAAPGISMSVVEVFRSAVPVVLVFICGMAVMSVWPEIIKLVPERLMK